MESIAGEAVMPWVVRGVAVILGGVGGYLLYRVVGCRTGYCPITRNPWISTLYGAVLGGMMFWK